jgi:hypothetical protein
MFEQILATAGIFVFLISFGFALILFRKDTSDTVTRNRVVFIVSGCIISALGFLSFFLWQDPFQKILSHSIDDEGYTLTMILTALLNSLVLFGIMSLLIRFLHGQNRSNRFGNGKRWALTAAYSLIITTLLEFVFIILHIT